MRKEDIQKLAEQQRKIADRNFMAYQETGITRYLRTQEKAEDLIELCHQALSAADDHQMVGIYKSEIACWGQRAIDLLHDGNTEKGMALLRDLAGRAIGWGLATDPWKE